MTERTYPVGGDLAPLSVTECVAISTVVNLVLNARESAAQARIHTESEPEHEERAGSDTLNTQLRHVAWDIRPSDLDLQRVETVVGLWLADTPEQDPQIPGKIADAARLEVKAAVEEWFSNVSLDDLFAVKGWAPQSEPEHGQEQTPAGSTRSDCIVVGIQPLLELREHLRLHGGLQAIELFTRAVGDIDGPVCSCRHAISDHPDCGCELPCSGVDERETAR